MIDKNKTLFTTGEFAELCRVSKQTLIYYDNINLFSPKKLNSKGYRYYTLSQYNTFSTLQTLKELNTPLSEIKEYLNNRNPQVFLDLLKQKKQEIAKEIAHLKNVSQIINQKEKATTEGIKIENNKHIRVVEYPERHLYLSDFIGSEDEGRIIMKIIEFEKQLFQKIQIACPFGVVVCSSQLLSKDLSVSYFFAKLPESQKQTANFIRPAGLYAEIIHKGRFQEIKKSYDKLCSFLVANNYIICGNSYEEALIDSCAEKNSKNFVSRISVQVKPKSNNT